MSAPLPSIPDRRTFQRLTRHARRAVRRTLILQGLARSASDEVMPPRLGLTASRKVGGAVVRNRARRRLREAARTVLGAQARPGWDYVLVARQDTATCPWETLLRHMTEALQEVHGERPSRRR